MLKAVLGALLLLAGIAFTLMGTLAFVGIPLILGGAAVGVWGFFGDREPRGA